MRSFKCSIIKPIVFGLFIGTVLMVAIYVSAATGSIWAVNMLLKMTLPPFNVAATFLEPVPLEDLERGGQRIDLLLMLAWAQISLIAATAVAGIRAIQTHKQQ